MTDKKFTDEEIIKALEYCNADRNECDKCVLQKDCESNPFYSPIAEHTLDLINRQKAENLELKLKFNELLAYKQEVTKNNMKNYEIYKSQKAEIERLKGSTIVNNIMESQRIKREAKTEAYKEFAERLKEKLEDCHIISDGEYCGFDCGDVHECLNILLKKMVGEKE